MNPSGGLDPRTAVVLVLVGSVAVTGAHGLRFVPPVLLLGLGLAAAERAWWRASSLLGAAALTTAGWFLPLWWAHPVGATVSIACGYLLRLVVVWGLGAHLVATTSPTRLAAGLRAWRVPRALSVTLAVMLRFAPVVATEARAVLDAMRLRGLVGPGALLRHPVRGAERFVVPMIASSLRASEDLSAAALLRGLGSPHTPTALHPPRFTAADAGLALAAAALAAAALLLPAPLR